jgi:hypothetical protein
MAEVERDTVEIQADGRTTIPVSVRKVVDLMGKKAWCQVENYGKDKVLLTIMNRFEAPKANKGIRARIKQPSV